MRYTALDSHQSKYACMNIIIYVGVADKHAGSIKFSSLKNHQYFALDILPLLLNLALRNPVLFNVASS